MLKIKDNVDLKELEKFGFKTKYDEDTGEIKKLIFTYYPDGVDILTVYVDDRKICFELLAVIEKYEKLYDLIKADLVEKVGDKEK